MKILLITSHTVIGFNNAPPIGLYRIRHQLQKCGFECDVLDLSLSDPDYWIKCAASGMYKIIGFSVSHFYMQEDIRLIEKFKTAVGSHPCLFLAGGQEVTFNYEQWLDCGIDGVVLGYGEEPMLQIAQSIFKNNCVNVNSIFDISGTAYRNSGKTIVNTTTLMSQELFNYYNYNQVFELDIPFEDYWDQARKDIKAHKFLKSNFIPETVRLYTSSHCPNNCGFCHSHNFLSVSEGRKSRIFMLDAQKIFDLVLYYIKSKGAKGFLFSDDEFLMNRQRAINFCNRVIDGKKTGLISQEIEFNCQARVMDFLLKNDKKKPDIDFILLLKEAGFHSISLGVETFSDRLLQTSLIK